jgi:hypothetical protein
VFVHPDRVLEYSKPTSNEWKKAETIFNGRPIYL